MPASNPTPRPVSRRKWFAFGCSSGLTAGLSIACALALALGALLWQQSQPQATTRPTALSVAAGLPTTSPTSTASATVTALPTLTRTLPARVQPSAVPITPAPSATATVSPTPTTATGSPTPDAIERPATLIAYTGPVGQLEAAQGLIAFLRRQQGQRVWLDIRFEPGQFRGRLIGADRHVLLYDDCPGRTTLPESDLSECTGVQLDLPVANTDTLLFGRDGDAVILRGVVQVGVFAGPLQGMWSVELASGS